MKIYSLNNPKVIEKGSKLVDEFLLKPHKVKSNRSREEWLERIRQNG